MAKSKKKVFFMKKKATAKVSKVAKIKGFLRNPYVEAATTSLLAGASYVIAKNLAEKIFEKKTRVDVDTTECETSDKTTVSHTGKKTVQLFAYTFTNYDDGADLYVCPRFRRPLDDEDLRRFKDLAEEGDEAQLIDALKQHEELYSLYVG